MTTGTILRMAWMVLFCAGAFGQTAATSPESPPKFEIADVRVSAKIRNDIPSSSAIHAGRFEVHHATMVDLVSAAYGVKPEKVVGGPSWLEMDQFDITAKIPDGTRAETAKLMLQSLLAERFSLVVHNDTQPVPAYALTAGKKPLLKQSENADEGACKFQVQGAGRGEAAAGTIPTIHEDCHGMTMAKLADQLPNMPAAGQYVSSFPVVDQTGLAGAWDFSFEYTVRGRAGTQGATIVTLFDAMDKLGLKLEPGKVPQPVLVVDSVNQTPTENSPEVAKAFPPLPQEFEVADIKPSAPDAQNGAQLQIQAGGRVNIRNLPLKFLVEQLWNISDDNMIIGAPKFMETDKWDIVAKAPAVVAATGATTGANGPPIDIDTLFGMLKTLLADRFRFAVHTEERTLPAYTLVAVKPKMKKADPTARTSCREGPPLLSKNDPRDANPVLARLLTCQNISMKQFAARLQDVANGYVHSPVLDSTGLEGGWDFTLNFSTIGQVRGGGEGAPSAPVVTGAGVTAAASDPNGAVSLNDAIEKQLGLKLELQKRPVEVLVIDHIDERPTDN